MRIHSREAGLTVIETIIAITIGLLFIVAGSQIYGIISRVSQESRANNSAIALATQILDVKKLEARRQCSDPLMNGAERSASFPGVTIPNDLNNASTLYTSKCVSGDSNLQRINVIVEYYISGTKYRVETGTYI